LVRAEKSTCFALTEPEAGSDAQAICTKARLEGDEWVIDGMKHNITNGDAADFAIVFAVTDAEKRAAGGITAFVVPREQYRVGKMQTTIADAHPSELWFDGARVPADHVIGEVGRGFQTAMTFLNAGRAGFAAQSLGLAEFCLDQAVAHAKSRTAFGKPLAANQGVSFPLAECKVEIEAMRWMTYHLAWSVDNGDSAALDSSIAKYYSTDRAYAVADRCLQVFGGMGLLREGPVERVLRHLRVLRVVEGASEVQKVVIARSLGLG
jgi:acyl-CoA dehydrogenase